MSSFRRLLLVALITLIGSSLLGRADAAQTPVSRVHLLDMLKRGEFDALEATLARYQAEFRAGQRSEWDVDDAYDAFVTSDAAVTAALDSWMVARPNSAAAHLARGTHRLHVAWLVRGTAFVSATHPSRLEEMHRLLASASADLLDAIEADPLLSIAYAQLIWLTRAHGDQSTIERLYHEGIEATPASAAIRFAYLGSLEPNWNPAPLPQALAQMKSAIDEMELSFGTNPDFAGLPAYRESLLADWLSSRGEHAAAIAQYDKVIALSEGAGYLRSRGWAHWYNERVDLALADFDRALAQSPEYAAALYARGSARWRNDRMEEGLHDLDRAVAIDPLNPEYLRERSHLLSWLGRPDEALADLDRALTYGAYDSKVHAGRGDLLRLKDPDAAVASYREALMLAPSDEETVQQFANFVTVQVENGDCRVLDLLTEYIA